MMVARARLEEEDEVHPAVAIALLALGVAAILAPRPAWLSWVVPPVLAGVAVASGVLGPDAAGRALRPLADPLAFVVCAVPFAVLLDRFGFFGALAERTGSARRGLGALWVLAGLVVALLNLDAAVVLLTPLYLRIAARQGDGRLLLGIQPLLLSCLASSALPISNLTNLIAGSALHLSTTGFLVHLAVPTLAASAAGFVAYRRLEPRLARLHPPGTAGDYGADAAAAAAAAAGRHRPPVHPPGARLGRRRLGLGAALAVAVVAGFLLTPSLGGQPWEVAAGGDVVLALALRSVPLAAIPWRVVLTVLGLGVLASAAAGPLHVDALLGGAGVAGVAGNVGLGAVGGSLFNNLPALLVALPGLARHQGFAAWGFLLGVNIGPLAVPSGTLAGLLWLETMRRLGAPLRDRDYLRLAWRVTLPGLLAALAALLVLRALLGPH